MAARVITCCNAIDATLVALEPTPSHRPRHHKRFFLHHLPRKPDGQKIDPLFAKTDALASGNPRAVDSL